MCTRVTVVSLSVCLFVCLSVTTLVPAYNMRVTIELTNLDPMYSEGFQLTDSAKKLSFPSYSLF